jgi:asparagine synthase (glutamine-hydrolysing)
MDASEVLARSVNDGLRGLLHYGDRMSMAHSIELRQPFLDYRLVEEVMRSDISARFEGGRGKQTLRRIGREVLPSQAPVDAPKRGFPVPTLEWIRDKECRQVLLTGRLTQAGLLNPRRLESLVEAAVSGRSPMQTQSVYRLLAAELWWRSEGW